MGGHPSARSEDPFGNVHPFQVFRGGFDPHQDGSGVFGSLIGKKYDLAGGRTGRGRKSLGQHIGACQGFLVEHRMQQFIQLGRLLAKQGFFLIDLAFPEQVHGNFYHGCPGTFSVPGLQQPEFAFLNGEFQVLHIREVIFQFLLGIVQFRIYLRHQLFQGGVIGGTLLLGHLGQFGPAERTLLGDLLGCPHPGDHILSLCVHQVLPVKNIFSGPGIPCKCHTGSRGIPHVPEDHGLYVDSRTPLFGDLVQLPVIDGAGGVPAVEYRHDGTPELLPGINREIVAGLVLDGDFELLHQLLQIFHRQLIVVLDATGFLDLFKDLLKRIDIFLGLGLHSEHHVAVHLYEPAVTVPCEFFISGFGDQSFYGILVHTEVQDSVHHPRHGDPGARAHGDQTGIFVAPEFGPHDVLDILHSGLNLLFDQFHHFLLTELVVFGTDFGGNGESRGYGNPDQVHLCKVGPFTAEQVLHIGFTFGFLVPECIHTLYI